MAIQLKAEIPLVNDNRNLLVAHSSLIQQNANNILLRVAQSDFTGENIITEMNLNPGSAKIRSPIIELEGLTTINNNFKVLLDGTVEAINGKFSGVLTATSGVMNNVNINTGTIGRFAISGNNLVYTSELFSKDYDESDLSKLSSILAEFEVATAYDKFVYDFNGDGLLDVLDMAKLSRIVKGLDSNPNKKIRSVITIGTTSGEIKTSTVAENGAVGKSFVMRADKLSGNLVNTKGFATEKMYLNGKEVTVDGSGYLKAT